VSFFTTSPSIVSAAIAIVLPFALLQPAAGIEPFPPGFRTQDIKADGATIHVRVGGP
jgi:hypothetical protein